MPTYSLLFIDADEAICASMQVECPGDEEAASVASGQAGDHRAIQVWHGDRPVCLVGNPRAPGVEAGAR